MKVEYHLVKPEEVRKAGETRKLLNRHITEANMLLDELNRCSDLTDNAKILMDRVQRSIDTMVMRLG